MGTASANLVDFHYELHGFGDQDIVLISGYGCDLSVWTDIIDELASDFRILIFDNQGAGRTEDFGEPLSIDVMAENSVALFEELGIRHPIIVGHSLGAAIAQKIAQNYPEVPVGLVLIEENADNEEAIDAIWQSYQSKTIHPTSEDLDRQKQALLSFKPTALKNLSVDHIDKGYDGDAILSACYKLQHELMAS